MKSGIDLRAEYNALLDKAIQQNEEQAEEIVILKEDNIALKEDNIKLGVTLAEQTVTIAELSKDNAELSRSNAEQVMINQEQAVINQEQFVRIITLEKENMETKKLLERLKELEVEIKKTDNLRHKQCKARRDLAKTLGDGDVQKGVKILEELHQELLIEYEQTKEHLKCLKAEKDILLKIKEKSVTYEFKPGEIHLLLGDTASERICTDYTPESIEEILECV
jgi:hypothetical protein